MVLSILAGLNAAGQQAAPPSSALPTLPVAEGNAMFIFKRSIIGPLAGLAVSVLVLILDALLRAEML